MSVWSVFGFGSSQSSYWPFSVLTHLLSVASCLLSVPNTLGRNIQCSELEANTHPDCEIKGEEVRLFSLDCSLCLRSKHAHVKRNRRRETEFVSFHLVCHSANWTPVWCAVSNRKEL